MSSFDTLADFKEYLGEQLIPDLVHDGFEEAAADFSACLTCIDALQGALQRVVLNPRIEAVLAEHLPDGLDAAMKALHGPVEVGEI
jgi:hypothetical protein